MIFVIRKFGELLASNFSKNGFRNYVKHLKECFIRFPKTSKLVKKKLGCPLFFQPTFSLFRNTMKQIFLVFDILLESYVFYTNPAEYKLELKS